jgi:hypothetical protein
MEATRSVPATTSRVVLSGSTGMERAYVSKVHEWVQANPESERPATAC